MCHRVGAPKDMPQKERDAIMQQLGSQSFTASVSSGDLPAFLRIPTKHRWCFIPQKIFEPNFHFLTKKHFWNRGFPCVVFRSSGKCTFLNELRMESVKAIEALCDHLASFFFWKAPMTTVFLFANLAFFFWGSHRPWPFGWPRFRSGSSRVLISTDLWGRGLDVQQAGSWKWDEVAEVAIVNGAPVFGLENAFFLPIWW